MTDRPIIFSAPMIRALLDGRKTQTRRVVKNVTDMPPPRCHPAHTPKRAAPYLDAYCGEPKTSLNPRGMGHDWYWWQVDDRLGPFAFRLPYAPGDRLWCKEVWGIGISDHGDCPRYKATLDYMCGDKIVSPHEGPFAWKSPRFMPKRFSRLTLLVTDVRVQRVQEISRGDAMEEGCPFANMADGPNPRDWYRDIWNSIHGPDAWDANPWVAAISFTAHRCNIDTMEEGTRRSPASPPSGTPSPPSAPSPVRENSYE